MDDCLQSLLHLCEQDTAVRKSLQEFTACIEFGLLQHIFERFKRYMFQSCTYNPSITEFNNSHFLIPSGSLEEGSLLSRYFGQRHDFMESSADKMELEFDMMFPVGEISAAQLIPCHQLGYFAIIGMINIRPSIPKVFQYLEGVEIYLNILRSASYSERGYFSATKLQDKYCGLRLDAVERKYLLKLLGIFDDHRFVSSLKINGPAVCWTMQWIEQDHLTFRAINIDGVFCVLLKTWPDIANEWINRRRTSQWPTERIVNEIIDRGCLLVVKNPLLTNCNHFQEQCDAELDAHWRLSFSLAEIRLSKERSDRHNYCYFVFKSVFYFKFSDLINRHEMSSYLVKTIFMWQCESLDFSKHEINKMLIKLFQSFKQCLVARFLPHYFIRLINLVENISEASRKLALEIIINTIDELTRHDERLIKEMMKTANKLLTQVTSISKTFRRCTWISFCWDSVSQGNLPLNDKLRRFHRVMKISSDTSMTGFIKLVVYVEQKSSCIIGIIQLIKYLFPDLCNCESD